MEQFSNQFVKIKIAHKWFKHTMGDCVRLFILWAPHTHSTQHTYTQTSHQYVRGNAAWSTGYARTPCEESGNSESVCGCEMRRFGRIYLFQLFLELFFILLVSLPLVFGFSAILLYLRLWILGVSCAVIRRIEGIFLRVIIETHTTVIRTHRERIERNIMAGTRH